jgi:hypothetical protein
MAEKTGRRISKKVGEDAVEFGLTDLGPASSPSRPPEAVAVVRDLTAAADLDAVERSPEFLELAIPKLPSLSKGNLARLLMQTPNRLYFYWSIGRNPFHTLNRALGQPGNYTLVLKLVNLHTDEERIHPIDEKGNWWFDVDADGEYRAEIGFYAVNRPYIRVLFSNTVTTPRKSPSPRTADTAEWRVPAHKFARVLDAAGFARDAFDVALAGDDTNAADIATRSAFAQFTGRLDDEFAGIGADELRYAMLALASGVTLAELRGLISERLFAMLSSVTGLNAENALAALKDKFEFDAEEFEIEDSELPTVFGASLIGLPRKTRKIPRQRDLGPLSSFSLQTQHLPERD